MRILDDPADAAQRRRASESAARLYRSLSAIPECREMERKASDAGADARWGWVPLFDDGRSRAGFLFLESGKLVPLHDHPNAMAVMFVVSGRIEIVQCDALPGTDVPGRLPTSQSDLAVRWAGTLETGNGTFLTGAAGNIHGFIARSDTIVLDLFVASYPYDKRSWFVPAAAPPASGDPLPGI